MRRGLSFPLPRSAMQYYYASQNNRVGPVDEAELSRLLQSGAITPGTLGWCAGMPQWAPLSTACPHLVPDIPVSPASASPAGPVFDYVGFWPRVGAHLIDQFLVNVIVQVLAGMLGLSIGAMGAFTDAPEEAVFGIAMLGGGLIGGIVSWLYYAIMESSSCQATLGKMAVGAKVVDQDGNRISFARATGREWSKFLSGIIFLFGYFMVGWDDRKQGLHDKIAGTYVVKSR